MRLKLLLLFLILLSGTILSGFGQSKPRLWHVADISGQNLFSVWADTVNSVDKNLYSFRLGDEGYLIKDTPLGLLARRKNMSWAAVLPGIVQQKSGGKAFKLIHSNTLIPVSSLDFDEIRLFQNSILVKVVNKPQWIWQPGKSEEIWADSISTLGEKLLLWTSKGLVFVNKELNVNFIAINNKQRNFSPGMAYFLSDSLWNSVNGQYRSFKLRPNSYWWNDTTYLDSSNRITNLQSPNISFKKLGDSVFVFSSGFLKYKERKTWFVRTASGKKIKTGPILDFNMINDTLLSVKTKKGLKLIAASGFNSDVNKTIGWLGFFQEGLLLAKAGKRYGFIDLHGLIRIACRYDTILPFVEGLSAARIGSQWGFLDRNERIAIQPHFERVSTFRNGHASVFRESKWALINRQGEAVLPFDYDKIEPEIGSGWKIVRQGWTGWANSNGNIVIQPKYFNSIEAQAGCHKVVRDGRFGLIDSSGKKILPLEFQQISIDSTQGLILYY